MSAPDVKLRRNHTLQTNRLCSQMILRRMRHKDSGDSSAGSAGYSINILFSRKSEVKK